MDWGLPAEALSKTALYAALQFTIGVATTHWLLMRQVAGAASGPEAAINRRLARWALAGAALVLAALLLRVFSHTIAAFGFDDLRANLLTVALESRWGMAWQRQFMAALLLLAISVRVRSRPERGWSVFSVVVVLVSVTIPFLGHAAGSTARQAIHSLHILASGAWIGTLSVLVLLASSFTDESSVPVIERLVTSFSPVALTGAFLLVASGASASLIYVGTVTNVANTTYGQVLLTKLSAVGGVVLCGWRNWRHSRAGGSFNVRMMTLELCFVGLALLLTGFLTELEHS